MAKRLTYSDALKLLGKNDSEVLDLAEKVADGGLGLVGVPDVFGVRGALVSKGRKALEGLGGKLRGESRLSRTEKIEAAYKILIITSFFEAAEEAFEVTEMPFGVDDLEITSEEQHALFHEHLATLRWTYPSFPIRHSGKKRAHESLTVMKEVSRSFARFICGLAVAERHRIHLAHVRMVQFQAALLQRASLRLEENIRRLSAEVPEFGMWLHAAEHEKTRQEIGTGLSDLHAQLTLISSDRPVSRRRQELAASYKAVLDRPILRSADAPSGLAFPSLGKAYIPPRGRVTVKRGYSYPARDDWWREFPVQNDLQSIVAALITHRRTTDFPVVVLGHPGAGKSKFTEMLAAQLPPEDFLAIRVELRVVSPNAPLHVQIEEGLRTHLHSSVSWRDLADDADGALPVIILDGFDELLQASGVDRSDYLERVQEFQQQQQALGQPVVVIVTSRTLVADRTRFPAETTIIRLEPFDDGQIEQMLQVWNQANHEAFHASGLSPLTSEVVLRYRDLTKQPLLLIMLMIYDAHGNALLKASDSLSHGELYERLLKMFARREVEKHRPNLGGRDLDRAIEDELRRLEVAAMAMFARGRQSVHAEELDRDLAVLMPEAAQTPENTDLHGQIAPAHQVLGRFFFVHEARSQSTDGTNSAFEFLHATFGEYLVARMVVAALEELVEDRARASQRRSRAPHLDDGQLYALASFAAYAGRDKVVAFLEELLVQHVEKKPELREEFRELLLELFQEAPFPAPNRSFTDYEPVRLPATSREAHYTANLVSLLLLISEDPVPLTDLYPNAADTWHPWRQTVALWRALPAAQWFGILDLMRMRHLGYWEGENQLAVLSRERGDPVNLGECAGFELRAGSMREPAAINPYKVSIPSGSATARLLRSTAIRSNGTASRLALIMTPYLQHVSDELATWYSEGEEVWMEAQEVLRLRLEPFDQLEEEQAIERLQSYKRLLSGTSLGRIELLTLRQAAEDLRLWPARLDRRTLLEKEVVGFLSRCTEIIKSSQIPQASVRILLEQLRPHIEHWDPSLIFRWEERGFLKKVDPSASLTQVDPSVPVRPGKLPESPGGSVGPV